MEVRPRVAVVGAGIGGLALAAVLAASGTRCEVFEQERRAAGDGAGLELAPNAVRPLRRLGLGPVLRAAAVRAEGTEIRGWDGRSIARLPLGAACERLFGAPYYTVHRPELHAALLDRVPSGRVHHGKRVTRLEEDGNGVVLHFEDGTAHRADVVVGADGVDSAVRAALGPAPSRFSGVALHHGLLPVERLPRAVARDAMVRLWAGPGARLVCFPVSGGSRVSFTAVTAFREEARESWWTEGDPDELAREFGHWPGLPSQIASAVRVSGTVRRRPLYDRGPAAWWAGGRVALLGDAACPGLLSTSHGAGQAVEDAFELAACLAGVGQDGVKAALDRYAALREPRYAAVREIPCDDAALRLPDGEEQRARDAALRSGTTLQNRAGLFSYDAGRWPGPAIGAGAAGTGQGSAAAG